MPRAADREPRIGPTAGSALFVNLLVAAASIDAGTEKRTVGDVFSRERGLPLVALVALAMQGSIYPCTLSPIRPQARLADAKASRAPLTRVVERPAPVTPACFGIGPGRSLRRSATFTPSARKSLTRPSAATSRRNPRSERSCQSSSHAWGRSLRSAPRGGPDADLGPNEPGHSSSRSGRACRSHQGQVIPLRFAGRSRLGRIPVAFGSGEARRAT